MTQGAASDSSLCYKVEYDAFCTLNLNVLLFPSLLYSSSDIRSCIHVGYDYFRLLTISYNQLEGLEMHSIPAKRL